MGTVKIMMVDDEATILLYYKAELEDEGYNVITAVTADVAVDLFEKEKPDIVTLDIMMPVIAGGRLKASLEPVGIQLLRHMKEINGKVPIVMLSAYEYSEQAAKLKCDGYVSKSTDLEPLKEVLREISNNMQIK